VKIRYWQFGLAVAASMLAMSVLVSDAFADGSGDPAVVSSDNGKYMDKDGNPTYKISPDGMVDWYTFSGFRRYHSDCHVCHGPNGEGSTYAPALANSLKTLSYSDFVYVYLRGRANDAIPGGRPPTHEDKSEAAKQAEASCTGIK
jgi:mono/diheme cytochrome c family protein